MPLVGVKELRKRAMSGDLSAQHKLGWMYYTGHEVALDYSKAANWWEGAARRGHGQSRVDLAIMFYRDMAGRFMPVMPDLLRNCAI